MKRVHHSTLLRALSVLLSVAGLGAASMSAIAQTSPSPAQPPIDATPASPNQAPVEIQPSSPTQVPSGTMQPTPTQSPATEAPATPSTTNLTLSELLQRGASAGSFKTLAKAVQAAGLAQAMQDGNFTVFAPTDEAFAALPAGLSCRS
jgi:uncharacterized surface protein with fasciclin (FAS1) repeats